MMTMEQLVDATGTPERTIREYIRRGVVPDGDQTGWYGEIHYLLAVARLREEGVRKHDIFRRRMAAMSPEELAKFAYESDAQEDTSPAPVSAVAAPPATALPAPPPAEIPEPVPAHRAEVARHEMWTRIVLRPGLELHVRSGTDEEVQRLAGEIDGRYGAAR